jgi:hypothetical protein
MLWFLGLYAGTGLFLFLLMLYADWMNGDWEYARNETSWADMFHVFWMSLTLWPIGYYLIMTELERDRP